MHYFASILLNKASILIQNAHVFIKCKMEILKVIYLAQKIMTSFSMF